MSKKVEEITFDVDDFDVGLDFNSEGGFQATKSSSGRKAIVEFGGSFLTGLKKVVLDPATHRRVLEKNAPSGIVAAYDTGALGVSGTKKLYSDTKEEFFKELGDVSSDAKTITGKYGKYVPSRLLKRIEDAAEKTGGRTFARPGVEESAEEFSSGLDAMLADVAKSQRQAIALNKKNSQESTGKIIASQVGTTTAVLATNKLLANLNNNNERLVSLSTAHAKLQRKGVEVAYNQLIIQRQQLDVLQQTKSLQEKAFAAIIKNTGLPEDVKATLWEVGNRSVKQKLVGMATERITGKFGDLFNTAINRVGANFKAGAGRYGFEARQGLSALAMQASLGDLMGSKSERAGSFAGQAMGMAIPYGLEKLLKGKYKNDPRAKMYGNNVENFLATAPGLFNKLQNDYGGFRRLTEVLGIGDLKATDSALNVRVRGSGARDLEARQAFNRKSQLALTEVIPGWLSRMSHSLEILSTGDRSRERKTYDYETGTFKRNSEMKSDAIGKIFNKSAVRDSRAQANKIVNTLDSRHELSKADRAVLLRYVLTQANSDNGYIDPNALTNAADSPIRKYNSGAAERIAAVLSNSSNFNNLEDIVKGKTGVFGNINKNERYQSTMRSANEQLSSLRTTLPTGMRTAVKMAGTSQVDMLKDTGVVDWDPAAREWRFNNDKYMEFISTGKLPKGVGLSEGGPGRSGPPVGMPKMSAIHQANIRAASVTGSVSPEIGSDGYTDFQRVLLETIESSSSKISVDTTNQILDAIRTRLDMGVPSGGAPDAPAEVKRKANLFRRLISTSARIGRKGKSFLSNAMSAQLKVAALPFRMLTGSLNAGASVLSNIFKGSANRVSVVTNATRKFGKAMGDVYVQGREGIALKLADIQMGKYRDQASGKIITTLKDIRGAVVDAAGNVVLSAEDYKQGLFTLVNGRRMNLLGGVLKGGANAIKGLVNLNTLPFRMASSVGGVIKGAVGRLLDKYSDIYVSGESSPRILGSVMRNGGYFTRDGKVLRSVFDINGDIVDATGNVILSLSDMSKGLVDKFGKPFKTKLEKVAGLVGRGAGLVKGIASGGFNAVRKIAALNLRVLKSPFKLGKSISSMVGSRASEGLKVSAHTADTVDAIYHLLDARMPRPKGGWNDRDGSGFRDGSREDILGRAKPKSTGDEKAKVNPASDERRGILGTLMALVGGMGAMIGTVRSWFGNIFGLMRLAAQTRLATAGLNAVGGLAGAIGGRRGRAGGLLGGLKNLGKSGMGRKLGLAALAGGAIMASQTGFAQSAMNGASSALFGSEEKAFAANNMNIGGGSSGSSGSNGSTAGDLGGRVMNGIGGSLMGEIAAIAAFPAMAALYNKAQGTKAGGKFLPTMQHGSGAGSTSKMGKLTHFLTGTNKGRMLTAALAGGGFVAGNHMLGNSEAGSSLGEVAGGSFASTLALELALATVLPAAIGKGKSVYDKYRLKKTGGLVGPHRPVIGGGLAGQVYNPAHGRVPGAGVAMPGQKLTTTPKPLVGPMRASLAPAAAAAPGMGGRLAGLGKGIFRNAGLLGTGFAAADALTTEGSAWDKTKAFGGSLLTTAAMGKAWDVGRGLMTTGGRTAAMSGASKIGGAVARHGLMQAGRTALMAGGTALAGMVSAPVILGGLAVAAVAGGAYLAYKKFYETDDNAIMRYRMAQYGIKHNDVDKVNRIAALETICKKHVKISGNTATLASSVPFGKVLEVFGVAAGDDEHIGRLATWFKDRFKPVFIRGLLAYRKLTGKDDLEKADGQGKELKQRYLADIGGIDTKHFTILVSPFPSEKKLSYDPDKVRSEFERSISMIGREKGKVEKDAAGGGDIGSMLSKGWASVKTGVVDGWDATKAAVANLGNTVADKASSAWKSVKDTAGDVGGWASQKASQLGNAIKSGATAIGDGVSNVVASMTGSQKQWQMMVYKAFKSAGFAEQQARILTAEIGRENSYNPKYLFGGHADPHKGTNLGMLSWQGDRKPRLIGFLKRAGVLTSGGNIAQNQAGLDAQAKFIMWELLNTHKKVGSKFLADPNIPYAQGAYLIGKSYILWRIDDPKYKAGGIKNRDGFYNMLLKQLGSTGKTNGNNPAPNRAGGTASSGVPTGIKAMAGGMVSSNSGNPMARGRLAPGNGVRAPGFQSPITPGPVGGPIIGGNIPKDHRAVKAAIYATQKANAKSTGYCARYVANALQSAGYKFERQNSAFMYASGPLASAGFQRVPYAGGFQIGDVLVWPAHGRDNSGGAKHGHIQIFNGKNWVSDYVQKNIKPNANYNYVNPTLWRDKTLIGKTISGAVGISGAKPTSDAKGLSVEDNKKSTQAVATPSAPKPLPATIARPAAVPSTPSLPQIPRISNLMNSGFAPTANPTDTAMDISRKNNAEMSKGGLTEMMDIQRSQLEVQKSMLSTLVDIKKSLSGAAPAASTTQTGGAIRGLGASKQLPISMDAKRN